MSPVQGVLSDIDAARPGGGTPTLHLEEFANILRLRTRLDPESPHRQRAFPVTAQDITSALDLVREAASRIRDTDERIRASEARTQALLTRAADELKSAEARAKAAEALAEAAETRARDAEARLKDAESRAQEAESWLRQIFSAISEELPAKG